MTIEVAVTTKQANKQEEQSQSALFLDGVLIDLRISYWRGKRPLSAQDLGLSEDQVPDIFSLGRKLVIPREALARFERVDARAHYLIDQFTFPFPTGHSRFIPYSVLPQVLEELKTMKKDFEERIRSFLDNYDQYRKDMLDKYPQYAEALSRGYSTASDIKKRFHYDYTLYEVSLPRNIRFKAVEERDAVADAEAKRRALEQAEEEYKRQFQAQIDEFLSSSVGKLREAVGDAVIALSERIQKGDAVSKGSLDSLKRTIERFRALNFVGDNEIEGKLAGLEKLIPDSGKKFEEAEFKQAFQTALGSVTSSLLESDISGVTGEYKRRLRM